MIKPAMPAAPSRCPMLVFTEPTRKRCWAGRCGRKDGGQGAHFDRVSQRRAGAVGFHVIEVGRRELGVGQRLSEDGLLGQGVGGGQSVAASVLIDGRAAEHGRGCESPAAWASDSRLSSTTPQPSPRTNPSASAANA